MIAHSKRLLYLHPAKTGGQSIETYLLQKEGFKDFGEGGKELTPNQRIMYGVYSGMAQHWGYERISNDYPFLKEWDVLTTVRHPFDRAQSEFWMRVNLPKYKNVPSFVAGDINRSIEDGSFFNCAGMLHLIPQVDYLVERSKIIRFETYHQDFEELFGERLSIHKNKRKEGQYCELNKKSKDILYKMYEADFKTLNYDPDFIPQQNNGGLTELVKVSLC